MLDSRNLDRKYASPLSHRLAVPESSAPRCVGAEVPPDSLHFPVATAETGAIL